MRKKVKMLFLSDLHLGSSHCNPGMILKILHENPHETLVIVGDLFEKDAGLQEGQFEIISYLHENRHKVICIDGNHDLKADGLVAKLLGIEVYEEYAFECVGKKFLALHGHRFDRICLIFDEPLIDKIFLHAIAFLRRLNVLGYGLEQWINQFHAKVSRQIAKKAAKYARKHGKDVVICGHTHRADYIPFDRGGKTVHYWNCGDWADFLTMDYEGNIESHSVRAHDEIALAS